jgi:hypothetical protein
MALGVTGSLLVSPWPPSPIARGAATVNPAPTGSAQGIAVARRVVAVYRNIPGIYLTASLRLGSISAVLDVRARLVHGMTVAMSGQLKLRSSVLRLVVLSRGAYVREPRSSCWQELAGSTARDLGAAIGEPTIAITGGHFWPPRREGQALILRDIERGPQNVRQPTVYRIDPKTYHILSVRDLQNGSIARMQALDQRPRIPEPRPRCTSARPAL